MKCESNDVNKTLCNVLLGKNLDDIKTIIQASGILVCERVSVKPKLQKQKESFWKKRIESNLENEKNSLSAA